MSSNRDRLIEEIEAQGLNLQIGGTKTIAIPPHLLQDMGVATRLRITGPQRTTGIDLNLIGWDQMTQDTKQSLAGRDFKPGRVNILTRQATEPDELANIETRVRQYFRRNGFPLYEKFADSERGKQIVPVFVPFVDLPKFQHYYSVNREEYFTVANTFVEKYDEYVRLTLEEERTLFYDTMKNVQMMSEREAQAKTDEHIRHYRMCIPTKAMTRGTIVFDILYEAIDISENSVVEACNRWLQNSPENEEIITAIGSTAEDMLNRVSNRTAWLAENIIGAPRKEMIRMLRDVITDIYDAKFMTRGSKMKLKTAINYMKKQFYGEIELVRLTEELFDVFNDNKAYIVLKDNTISDMNKCQRILQRIYAILNVTEADMVKPTAANATSRFRKE